MKKDSAKKGIVFFDLDGTLLDNSCDTIYESTLYAIAELKQAGYYVVLSTGRDMDNHYSCKYKSIVNADAIIHQNGNRITIGEETLFHHWMDEALVRKIYEYALAHNDCFGTTIATEDFFTNVETKRKSDDSYPRDIVRNFVPFEQLLERHLTVNAMSFAGNMEVDLPRIERDFPMLKLYPFSGGVGADVVEKEFSKAAGMKRLCEYYEIPEECTFAFGDSPNDIPMFSAAGTSIAMGNAMQEVKDAADIVTDDIDQDGIYKACVRLGLIPGRAPERREDT